MRMQFVGAFLLLGLLSEVCAEFCPGTIGSDVTTEFGENSNSALFLNLEDPAQCSGTVTAYHYCYYYFNGQSPVTVVFMVYRPGGNGYRLVDGSQHTVQRTSSELESFGCEDEPLEESEQFEVQQDDVIGACLVDTSEVRPLPVHAQDANGHTIYSVDPNSESCLLPEFPLTVIDSSDLEERQDYALYLYADIVSLDSTPSPTVDTEPSSSPTGVLSPQKFPMAATSTDNTPPTTTGIPQVPTTALPQTSPMAATSTDNTPPTTTGIPQAPTTALPQTSPIAATSMDGMSTAMTTAFLPETSPEASDSGQSSMPEPVMQTSVPHTSPMTATSEESMPTSTSANEPPPAPQSDGGGLDVIPAVVGVCVTMSVLVLIIIALLAVVVVALRSKRRKNSANLDNIYTLGNVAYGDLLRNSTVDEELYAVPSYDSKTEGAPETGAFEVPVPSLPTIDYESYAQPTTTDIPTLYSEVHYYSTIASRKTSMAMDYSNLLQLSHHRANAIYQNLTQFQAPAAIEEDLYAELKSYGIRHIPREHIEITHSLGSGQFGNVDKGIWTTPFVVVDVMVKTLSAGQDKVKFLQEAAIMAQFRHPNIVLLHGVVCKGSLMLIVELAHKGDLRQVLLAMKTGDSAEEISKIPKLLRNFSVQIALGMQYLSSKGFIHRDLAARNILVSNNDICKISDFGMSRDLETGEYYVSHGGKVPVKWTAPEALQYKKYSTASDVWSYGCLLYEIWSLGRKPFVGVENHEVLPKLSDGYRLPPPPGCPRVMYGLMIQCWHPDPSLRPDFRSLLLTLLEEQDLCLPLPEDAQVPHPLAGTLGSPLETGEGLYPDLQKTYLHTN